LRLDFVFKAKANADIEYLRSAIFVGVVLVLFSLLACGSPPDYDWIFWFKIHFIICVILFLSTLFMSLLCLGTWLKAFLCVIGDNLNVGGCQLSVYK